MDGAGIEARATQAGAREHVGGELPVGVVLDQGDAVVLAGDPGELPVGVGGVLGADRRDAQRLEADRPAHDAQQVVRGGAGIGLALDVNAPALAEHSPGEVERVEGLRSQLTYADGVSAVVVEPELAQGEQAALGHADLLLTIPRDHVEALAQVGGDRVGREGEGLEQITVKRPR